jgi:HD-GYP domain-containing protein (c-di-GMP phosphodiesterase class II)
MQVLAEFRAQQGQHWEPKLVDTLELLVMGLQQGLNLPVALPKISAGMWLIDAPGKDVPNFNDKRVKSSGY